VQIQYSKLVYSTSEWSDWAFAGLVAFALAVSAADGMSGHGFRSPFRVPVISIMRRLSGAAVMMNG
jgi:hypothetical protein